MEAVVCTLFEGHYHYGVAALTNSLFNNGFKGEIYAGYKGELPIWANNAVDNDTITFENAKSLYFSEGVTIHFLPMKADVHFTNYKPQFALDIFKNNSHIQGLFYFDPDIVIKCNWRFFEKWITYGVAVVHEITNHDMAPNHPVRKEWEAISLAHGYTVTNQLHSYINAGFFGLLSNSKDFLTLYNEFISISENEFSADVLQLKFGLDRSEPFFARDQDALNIAAMCCQTPLSEYGPEGMDFVHGGRLMSHAIGSPKPWKKNFLSSMFRGKGPTLADRAFWNNSTGIISIYKDSHIKYKKLTMKVSSYLTRFYKRH